VRTAAALLAALAAACAGTPAETGQVAHVVLVWLKDPGDGAVKARLVANAQSFPDRIPGLLSVSVGDALPGARSGADSGFDLAFVMRFRDARALAVYEAHPVHTAAVRELLAPNVARLAVYDAVLR
jgi:hypothetical protein